MGWIEYFFGWDQRPRIPHHLVTRFDISRVDDDELIVFKAGKARDRSYVRRLMRLYQADNAVELLRRLPKRQRPTVRERLRTLIQRWEGSLPYDPLRRDVRAIRAAAQMPISGIRQTKLKVHWRR